MNKFHNGKASAGKGPTPGNTGVNHAKVNSYSTANWNTNLGPTGPKRNRVRFPEIRSYIKQRLPDDDQKRVSMMSDEENKYESIHGYEAKMSARISGNEDRYNKLYGGASASLVRKADSTFNYKRRKPGDNDSGPMSKEIEDINYMRKKRK